MALFGDSHDQPKFADEASPSQQEPKSPLHSHDPHDRVVSVHVREVEALLGTPLDVTVTFASHTDRGPSRPPALGRRPPVGRHTRLGRIHVLT